MKDYKCPIAITLLALILAMVSVIAFKQPTTIECGACGAHVVEYHVVRNDDNTAWVNVCNECYKYVNN